MPNFEIERRMEMDQIRNRLEEVRQTIYADRESVGRVEAVVTGKGLGPGAAPRSGWKPFAMHGRWGGFDQTTWFRMNVTIPASMRGRRVAALIRPGGESLAYVDGKPFGGLDINHDQLILTGRARGGEKFSIMCESVPSVRLDLHHNFEYADIAVIQPEPWEFYWDATVAHEVLAELEPDSRDRRRLLESLKQAVFAVDLQHVNERSYVDSLSRAREMLRDSLKEFPSHGMGRLVLTGHSHIDTAWLWPLRETKRKCGRTFSTILQYMDRYPDLVFMCSQPVQYEWMKKYYPGQYARIKKRVKEGRWEPIGAMWVESDCQVPSGESITRQLLYGNRFFRREFGIHSRTAWLPDVFGFSWSLPQILKKAQVDTFVTTKINWSRYTDFPYSAFQWEGADGTRVFCLMPPLVYNGDPIPKNCIEQWRLFKQKERFEELPYPIGWGDGGGGPSLEMMEHARRLGDVTGVPKCEMGPIGACIERMKAQAPPDTLPVYNDELYLELHRGCQTTQARVKRHNRQAELLLRQTEFLNAFAMMKGGRYEQEKINDAWKIVLTNQFHDILPGSSITEVYSQAEIDYAEAKKQAAWARASALRYLIGKIDTRGEGMPIVVCNTLSWMRDDCVHASLPLPKADFVIVDAGGQVVPHQVVGANDVLFQARNLPPLGYAMFRCIHGRTAQTGGTLKAGVKEMENDYVRVKFDARGRLSSVFDKTEGREVLAPGARGNVLQFFDDRPHYSDAWDIDHNVEEIMWEAGAPESVEVVEEGPVRAIVRMVWRTERSGITQDVTLHAHTPRVDFVTHVDWHEKRVLMKAAFPVDVRASNATYEIQWAAIERPTHQNRDYDRARFEVPAQKWADLSEGDYGVSLLNDCKYGYDIKGNVMRLSLLRSPVDPDPHADEGEHQFTYSLYPHGWDWRESTVQEAYALNEPPLAVVAPAKKGTLQPIGTFAVVDADNVVIDTVKKAEDSRAVIVRLYEAHGQRGEVSVTFDRKPKQVAECDLMEENDQPLKFRGNVIRLYVKPFDIRTLKVLF